MIQCFCTACTNDVSGVVDQVPSNAITTPYTVPTRENNDSSSEKSTAPETAGITESNYPEDKRLKEIIPSLSNPKSIHVQVIGAYLPDRLSEGEESLVIYAPTSESQFTDILDYIELIDSVVFIEVEADDVEQGLFSTSTILVKSEDDACAFAVSASADDSGIFYIVVSPIQNLTEILSGEEILSNRFFKGQFGTFPIREFNDILTGVLLDTSDLQNVAVVKRAGSDEPDSVLNKSVTAILRRIVDAELRINGPIENTEEHNYDVKYIVGNITYSLSTTTGYFAVESGGETINGKLDEETLRWFLGRAGTA